MATFTIRSRRYGKITFQVPDKGCQQITVACDNLPLSAHGLADNRGRPFEADASSLERRARHWWRKHLAAKRASEVQS